MQKIVPTEEQMRRYLKLGLSSPKIAAKYEEETGIKVSASAIRMALARYGLSSTKPRPRHDDLIPWKVNAEHEMNKHLRLLRLEARRQKGMQLSAEELSWVQGFLDFLKEEDAVVAYNPRTKKGFWLVTRDPEQDDPADIIRRPKVKA